MREVFAVGRGQYENIGDIVLRRQLLDWVRPAGPMHVYVGSCTPSYVRGLGLAPTDRTYSSLRAFYLSALHAALAGRGSYVFKPGEIQLTLVGLKEHLSMLPLLAVLRARGGRAVRVGVGSRNFAPLPRALMRPSIMLSDTTLWRDTATGEYMGTGAVMPDLAFAEGADDATIRHHEHRDALVISLRGDNLAGGGGAVGPGPERPYPTAQALAGIRAFAARHHLEVWAVTQVLADDGRSHRLAEDLGGRVLAWDGSVGHDEQEERLRALYARTAVVLSDRLHVDIAAFTDGAVPVSAAVGRSRKVERHFATIGVDDIHLDLASTSEEDVAARLGELLGRRDEFLAALASAREELEQRRIEVLAVLSGGPRGTSPRARLRHGRPVGGRRSAAATGAGDRPRVHHLGRSGEVAGGMTQVLNGYLAAEFDRVDVDVITSRGEPHDTDASVRLASRAAVRVVREGGRGQVVVAHLSERGSFLREGALLRLARLRGTATVAHLHGSSFASFAAAHPRLTRSVLRSADRIITLSAEASAIAAHHVGADRVHLVPNAILPGAPQPKTNTVVFGGTVGHRKGVDVLQDAWEALAPEGWELLVAGPVKEPAIVRRGIPGMTFLGPTPHRELMALLDRSSIAVLPSRDEAMPMFVLEAMARGNAVISTDVGGVAAVLRDDRGLVVPAGDAEALRGALEEVIGDAHRRAALAGAALAAFDAEYSAERVFPTLEAVWCAALQDAAGRRS